MLPAKKSNTLLTTDRSNYLNKIAQSMFEQDSDGSDYDLIITLSDTDISFREFGSFLITIDDFYGRFYKKGFLSYAKTQKAHLKASEIRHGSIEIIVQEILKKLAIHDTIYFFLMIKYLPALIKEGSEVLKNLTESFHNYENAKLVRLQKKSLSKELRKDELLENLTDEEIRKLNRNLKAKYPNDKKKLKGASKFASQKLLSVQIQKKKN